MNSPTHPMNELITLIATGIANEVMKKVSNEIGVINTKINHTSSNPHTTEFGDDLTARTEMGGGKKPISKAQFNKIRKEGKIKTYFPSPGRTSYNLAEIRQYISTTGKESSILPAKRKQIK
jgi:hypothetical protein